ncbi:transketolase [Halanaerobium hydrogeniformans]|uniref:Transketolase n=1 Tax=Halanaerobium hydrogeniformans TaxID=656519 RepID=E4RMR0_HALHG|nr:transketolase [Halanaerobium hydrogeniformans]ADQ14127.1 transketolase [Halanaerobium hydrogeniformans]
MLNKIAKTVRGLAADAVEDASSGHPGLPIGCADIGAVLYGEVMNYDPQKTDWANRDRFVLSAGHGSMLQYAYQHLAGFDLSIDDLKSFRQLGSKTPGHPEYGWTPGVETTTGPLGQGFANAVGMALAEEIKAAKFNTEDHKIVDHYTYSLAGDGCMMEGVTSEAASLAGHLGLGKLIVIYDDNDISIAGNTDLTFTEDVAARFKAYNWQVIENVDGHDAEEIKAAINKAKAVGDKPSLIMAKTKIACGAPTKEGTAASHGAPLGQAEVDGLKENIGLPVDEKYYIPGEVKKYFAEHQAKLKTKRLKWESEFSGWAAANPELKKAWDKAENQLLPEGLKSSLKNLKIKAPASTRDVSGAVLKEMADQIDYLLGGSADLAPSNRSYLDKYAEIQKDNYNGRNLRFGVREHAMGAIVNGISLYGGFRPYCATFLVFSDYMKPAIRMAALMKQPVIYIFTHDSIYIGEDGPTHQPVEHLEALRIIPGLKVLRPADEEETKAAWLEALENKSGPTALILTRQGLDHLDKENDFWTGVKKGGYTVLSTQAEKYDYTFLASGSEVSLAVETANKLIEEEKKDVRVISVPDRKTLAEQKDFVNKLTANSKKTVVIEAGIGNGWYKLLKGDCELITVEDYGESGPGQEIAEEKGFSVDKIIEKISK